MSAVIYRHTQLSRDPKAFWKAYFSCLSADETNGIQTTDGERARFASIWKRGDVVWRDDGSLMRAVGLTDAAVPDAVYSHPSPA